VKVLQNNASRSILETQPKQEQYGCCFWGFQSLK